MRLLPLKSACVIAGITYIKLSALINLKIVRVHTLGIDIKLKQFYVDIDEVLQHRNDAVLPLEKKD